MYCDIPERKRQSTAKIFEGDSKLLKKIREAKVPNNFYVFLKIQDLMWIYPQANGPHGLKIIWVN